MASLTRQMQKQQVRDNVRTDAKLGNLLTAKANPIGSGRVSASTGTGVVGVRQRVGSRHLRLCAGPEADGGMGGSTGAPANADGAHGDRSEHLARHLDPLRRR